MESKREKEERSKKEREGRPEELTERREKRR